MADGKYISRRERAAAIATLRCALCPFTVSRFNPSSGEVWFRGKRYLVCGACRAKYSHCLSQIAMFGFRFRFVERCEIPRPPVEIWNGFAQVYKILLLLKERQEIREKEVNWMPEDMARKVLKLQTRVAAAMKDTFGLRGDGATVPDDVALLKIKDLLEEIDPEIFKKLSRKRKRLSKA